MSDATEEPVCFICLEGGSVHRLCRCSTAMHIDCQVKMIKSTPAHYSKCAVCLMPYANVAAASHGRRLSRDGQRVLMFTGGVGFVLAMSFYEGWLYLDASCTSCTDDDRIASLTISVVLLAAGLGIIVGMYFAFRRSTLIVSQQVVTVRDPTRRTRTVIVVSPPPTPATVRSVMVDPAPQQSQ